MSIKSTAWSNLRMSPSVTQHVNRLEEKDESVSTEAEAALESSFRRLKGIVSVLETKGNPLTRSRVSTNTGWRMARRTRTRTRERGEGAGPHLGWVGGEGPRGRNSAFAAAPSLGSVMLVSLFSRRSHKTWICPLPGHQLPDFWEPVAEGHRGKGGGRGTGMWAVGPVFSSLPGQRASLGPSGPACHGKPPGGRPTGLIRLTRPPCGSAHVQPSPVPASQAVRRW